MSFASFLASDSPMREVENLHIQLFSVNEALEKGIDVPSLLLESSTIDKDKPGVLLWADSEESMGEITITNAEKSLFRYDNGNLPDTDLQCFSTFEWRYTDERANKLVKYIQEHLEKANELEIWHTWIGSDRSDSEEIKKHSICLDELTVDEVKKLFEGVQYDCIAVKKLGG